MPAPPASPSLRILKFGVFEADLVSGELRKAGVRVRLQEQPFQILLLLIERQGDVITREELRQKLWPADTFVDFDHSLNTAVNKLREALGDSASSPHYVETLARRGYRFLASVERVPSPTGAAAEVPARTNDSSAVEAPLHPELEVPVPRRGFTRALFGLIQVMYLAFYTVALFRLRTMEEIVDSFLPAGGSLAVVTAVLLTAGIGIPLRCYLLSAIAFDHRGLGDKFLRIFPLILVLDQIWALAPFLLISKIGFGAAFAATATLLYVPFSERTLVRLAYWPK
jgi:cholera toxin transcriptional activator